MGRATTMPPPLMAILVAAAIILTLTLTPSPSAAAFPSTKSSKSPPPTTSSSSAPATSSTVFPLYGDVYPHGLYFVSMSIGSLRNPTSWMWTRGATSLGSNATLPALAAPP
uniref:Uncharacterized protein n=1 Tax=Ananas comosus var. bracteatus TaxID=296719 RepID=A0A6V7Q1J1_ANACO|nr:unnamed protein product [Ananas comosus var. bracteatus]